MKSKSVNIIIHHFYVVVLDELAPEMPAVAFVGRYLRVCASARVDGVQQLHRHLWPLF